jgi:hypothetical protein
VFVHGRFVGGNRGRRYRLGIIGIISGGLDWAYLLT